MIFFFALDWNILYKPVLNSYNFLKVLEHILLPHLEKHLPVHENKFAYRPAAGYVDAITVSIETVIYYNSQRSDVNKTLTS